VAVTARESAGNIGGSDHAQLTQDSNAEAGAQDGA
jgi:hypothetical protein